jgi:hypothetical protein
MRRRIKLAALRRRRPRCFRRSTGRTRVPGSARSSSLSTLTASEEARAYFENVAGQTIDCFTIFTDSSRRSPTSRLAFETALRRLAQRARRYAFLPRSIGMGSRVSEPVSPMCAPHPPRI